MRYDKPGYGDPITWGPCTGHPNDPRSDEEIRDKKIEELTESAIPAIRAAIAEDDETAISVADFLGRTINDIEIVDIIRAILKGDRASVYNSMKDQMEEAIWLVAEENAILQLETSEKTHTL